MLLGRALAIRVRAAHRHDSAMEQGDKARYTSHMQTLRAFWASFAILAACATTSSSGDTEAGSALRSGDPDGPPTIGALPDVARAGTSPRVQQGLSLARQVLAARLPAPPADHSYAMLQAWIDRDVATWVAKRRDGVDEARYQFGLEHEVPSDERVVGDAVLGLMQEDTALVLAQLPAPSELDSEPEIAEMFREMVRTQVQPFQTAAVVQYRDCATTAHEEGNDLQRWVVFCGGRLDRLSATLHASR